MRLERMNEQQIRCTLTKEDLDSRKIGINELAYGTDKARSLFREMMTLAASELDFIADDMPLMIEAVPMSQDCLDLIITKVEDPEELDTRFAQFSPSILEDNDDDDEDDYTSDFMPLPGYDTKKEPSAKAPGFPGKDGSSDSTFSNNSADSNVPKSISKGAGEKINASHDEPKNLVRLFSFESMSELLRLAPIIAPEYTGQNSLYKDAKSGRFLLVVCQSGIDLTLFNRLCNIISEYGDSERNLLATNAYLEEHCELILKDKAIAQLATV